MKSSDSVASSLPGAFPGDDLDKTDGTETPSATADAPRDAPNDDTPKPAEAADPFGSTDEAKAKADFENAFAAFTTSKNQSKPSPEANKSSTFDSEFPPISELERDEEEDSDSSSDNGGFDDNFTPASPPAKAFGEKAPAEESPESTHAAPVTTSPPAQEAHSPPETKAR
jgi:epidermal growth factor receptor substrate 15